MTQGFPYRLVQTNNTTTQDPREQIGISPAQDGYTVAVVCQSELEWEMILHMLDRRDQNQTSDSSYVSESGMSGGHRVIIAIRKKYDEIPIDSLIGKVCKDFPSISLLLVLVHGVPTPASIVRPGDAVVVRGDGKKWSADLPVKLAGMDENIANGLRSLSRDLASTKIKPEVHHGSIFHSNYCDGNGKQLCFNDRQIPQEAFGRCLVISGIGEKPENPVGPVIAAACAISIIRKLKIHRREVGYSDFLEDKETNGMTGKWLWSPPEFWDGLESGRRAVCVSRCNFPLFLEQTLTIRPASRVQGQMPLSTVLVMGTFGTFPQPCLLSASRISPPEEISMSTTLVQLGRRWACRSSRGISLSGNIMYHTAQTLVMVISMVLG
jgi:hypothetical protein